MRLAARLTGFKSLLSMLPISEVLKFRASRRSPVIRPPTPIRIRALNSKSVLVRPGTTDSNVLVDTFLQQYHLPPFPIREDGTIVDLGANVGYTVAHFATRYPRARVIGVELDQENYEIAKLNTARFGSRVSLVLGGIWIHNGTLNYGGTTEWGFRVQAGPRSAPALTMDTLLRTFQIDAVEYLKMDIEGAEAEVLFKKTGWLNRVRSINLEVHVPATIEGCAKQLASYGFAPRPHPRHPSALVATLREATSSSS